MNDLDTFETALLADLRELVDARAARRRRRRRLALAGGAVAAAAASAAVIGVLPQGTGPLAPQRADASVVLTRAAAAASQASPSSGTYWYTRVDERLRVSKTDLRKIGGETWLSKDGTQWFRGVGRSTMTKERVGFSLCDKRVTYQTLLDLPTDVEGLRGVLRPSMENNDDGPVPPKYQTDFITGCAISLLGELPASPEVRSAAFELLSQQPGVRNLGPATDAAGRSGTRLRCGDTDVIIDEQEGTVLQDQQSDGSRHVVLQAQWTDTLG